MVMVMYMCGVYVWCICDGNVNSDVYVVVYMWWWYDGGVYVIYRVGICDGDVQSDEYVMIMPFEDPSNQPILWGPEDELYHDNALVYTMPRPPHLQVNHLFD
jgi:hypothetical protein